MKIKEALKEIICEPKPDYDELYRQNEKLKYEIFKLEEENKALRYSLTEMYVKLNCSQTRENEWKEDYHKEHNRAEKLYEKLEKQKKRRTK